MHLTNSQKVVLEAYLQVGDVEDGILADRCHHIADLSSSGVRTRRRELERSGLVVIKGTKKLRSGRNATVFGLSAIGRKEARKLSKVIA